VATAQSVLVSSAHLPDHGRRHKTNTREEFMRAQLAAFTIIATAVAAPAWAQTAAPVSVFMSDKDITALVDKAKADRKGDAPIVAEPILQLAPYKAQLEYRPGTGPAAYHEHDAELMVVLQGTGNIVTEGKLVDEKRVNANNLSGSSIAGGVSHQVVKGDMILIPYNTPHQVIPGGGAPIVLMTMHVPYPAAGWPPAN
jgi:mannose-6-phosphate isomerase-like protein (cupin superfamily)